MRWQDGLVTNWVQRVDFAVDPLYSFYMSKDESIQSEIEHVSKDIAAREERELDTSDQKARLRNLLRDDKKASDKD